MSYNGNTVVGEYKTPDGSTASHGEQIGTDTIAEKLVESIQPKLEDFHVERNSDVILFRYTGGELNDFSITVSDGDGGANILCFTDQVGDIGKLSRFAPHDYVVKVTGADNSEADDWYLRFDKHNKSTGLDGEGLWIETVAPDVEYKLDQNTMPRVIRKDDNGDFIIEKGEWEGRRVGDKKTNPDPSFIGNKIKDLALFQGRLVILAGHHVVMSRTNQHLDFWKNSATQLVDDDVIDVSSATRKSAPIMCRAVPHNRDLVIFAESAQFVVFGRNAITPKNTSLVLTTTYEANLKASPAPAGKNVFYAVHYGGFCGIKEFYTEGEVDINASRPITSHCTQYLEGDATLLSTSTNFDLLLVHTNKSKRVVYAYEYLWLGDEKVQSAWSKWVFEHDVLFSCFIADTIYLVCSEESGRAILLSLRLDRFKDNGNYQVHLDHKIYVRDVELTLNLPEYYGDTEHVVAVQGDGCPNPGMLAPVDRVVGKTLFLTNSLNGGTVICGLPYKSETTLTPPVIRDSSGEPITTGTLSVHHYSVHLVDSGYSVFTIQDDYEGDTDLYEDARLVGDSDNTVGVPAVDTFSTTVPFLRDTSHSLLKISSDRHTPLRVAQVSWKGSYIKRGTHI